MKKVIALILAAVMVAALAVSVSAEEAPQDVKAIVEEMKATANWDQMALDSGIADRVEKIVEVDKDYVWKIGTPSGGRLDQNEMMANFEAYIEASTAGKVQVELYPLSQLGTNNQMIEGVLDGSITAWLGPVEYLYNYAPGVGVSTIPFLFEGGSYQVAQIYQMDPVMDDYLATRGFWNIAWGKDNSGVMTSNKKIESIDDFKGLKIWCLPTEMQMMLFKDLGADVVTLDSSDVSMSFQNGAVSAGVAGITFQVTVGKVNEVADYVYKFPFNPSPICFVFSQEFKESLPQELVDLIEEAGDIIDEIHNEYTIALLNDYDVIAHDTMEVLEIPDGIVDQAKEATAHIHDFYKELDPDCAAIYEKVLPLIEQYPADENRGLW